MERRSKLKDNKQKTHKRGRHKEQEKRCRTAPDVRNRLCGRVKATRLGFLRPPTLLSRSHSHVTVGQGHTMRPIEVLRQLPIIGRRRLFEHALHQTDVVMIALHSSLPRRNSCFVVLPTLVRFHCPSPSTEHHACNECSQSDDFFSLSLSLSHGIRTHYKNG